MRPNVTQSNKMGGWLDMLRSTYNWSLADRMRSYNQQFIQGDYCDIRTRGEACPLTCFVSKKVKGSKNRKKAASKLGRFHEKITDKRVAYQWDIANKIVSIGILFDF
ncbi:MAG: helix-turn-helix domain-containing protein [Nostoc sp.]